MTVAELKNVVLHNTDDSVDAAILLGWLNRGYEYVQQFVVLPELETTATLTFTAGEATLPTDFLHFVELDIAGNKYRTEIDYETRSQFDATAKPYAYYFWGSTIGVLPSYDGDGTLAYVKMAASLASDSETPKLPTIFQPLIAEYAIGLLRAANGNYAKALSHYTEVDNAIDRLTGKLRRRTRRQTQAWHDIRDQYPNYP